MHHLTNLLSRQSSFCGLLDLDQAAGRSFQSVVGVAVIGDVGHFGLRGSSAFALLAEIAVLKVVDEKV